MVKKSTQNPQKKAEPKVSEFSEYDKSLAYLKKKPWTEEEDAMVMKLVEKYGPQKWSFIAKFVQGRAGKQCRERWHNHLNPKILKEEWS